MLALSDAGAIVIGIVLICFLSLIPYVMRRDRPQTDAFQLKKRGKIVCRFCGATVAADALYEGQHVQCPSCHAEFTAPTHGPEFLIGLALFLVFIGVAAYFGGCF